MSMKDPFLRISVPPVPLRKSKPVVAPVNSGDELLGVLENCQKQVYGSITPLADSGDRREFETGAIRDMQQGKGRCDLLPACALLRLARHYEAGANKYSPRNWEKGMPISVMMDSAIRHLLKYLDGRTDEDHLAAAAWNVLGAMWMEEKRPEQQDIDTRKEPANV